MKTIVLGGGCFWCTEAIYQQIVGVKHVTSGYAGGSTPQPSYQNIGDHAEVIEVTYDDQQILLPKLLEIFFYVHDPTTLDRQGNDVGRQYRSIILVSNDEEMQMAENAKRQAQLIWDNPIVTEIHLIDQFYPAEIYHQNFYNENQEMTYCRVIINPKLDKFRRKFSEYLIN